MSNERKLRIFHILNHTEKANGHVCAVVDLACTQAKQGHSVYVCSRGGQFDNIFSEFGVEHIRINQDRRILTLIMALNSIKKILKKLNPDIVHAHMMTGAVLVAILRPFAKFKFVATVHNEFHSRATLMGLANRVIAVSESVRQSMIRRGIPSYKLKTVLNGTVNSPRFSKSTPSAPVLYHPAIMFVGGLHPRKGVDDLIRAFGIVLNSQPKAHLYIIGEGPFKDEYTSLAKSVSTTNITFCGHLDDPRSYLVGADIFVLASHADPAPLVIAEARDAGCAILATNVDGIPEMVDNGDAGILVPPKKPDQLANAILKLLSDPSYLAEMRNKSRRNISNFTVERVSEETERVYRDLLGSA